MATKGIPSIPDVTTKLTEEDLYRILEPLVRTINIRQGQFDPTDRWVTQQDLIDMGVTTQEAVESPIVVVPPTVSYDFKLIGDVVGGPTAMANGSPTINMSTAMNLPNLTCFNGGNAASTYPGQTTGPYGVVTSALIVEDEGSELTASATKMNFAGAGVTATNPTADEILVTIPGGGGGGGAWELLDTDTISGSPSESVYTWDETSYSDIRIVVTGIQGATDGTTFRMQVGHSNGATYWTGSDDYDGVQLLWESNSLTNGVGSGNLDLAGGTSNAAGETINATIEILGGSDSNMGCMIHVRLMYTNNNSNVRAYETRAFLDTDAGAGGNHAVDTFRIYFSSGNFANVGDVKTYGLSKT